MHICQLKEEGEFSVYQAELGLLFMELMAPSVMAISDDIKTEIEPTWLDILIEAKCDTRVIAVLCEKRLAGQAHPNVAEAIFISGCACEVEEVVKNRDKLLLTTRDLNSLTHHLEKSLRSCEVAPLLAEEPGYSA